MKRVTKTKRTVLVALMALAFAAACVDNDDPDASNEPVTPPETPERSVPVMGGPDGEASEEPPPPEEFVPEDRVSEGSQDECCPVAFSFRPARPDRVANVVLRGSLYPLSTLDGQTLQETDGIWSGESCLAPDEFGTYYYEVELLTASEGTFTTMDHNPYAPTTTSGGEIVNMWAPGDDCASIDVTVHARIEE